MSSSLLQTSFNTLSFNYEPVKLVDVVSSTVIYIGTSETSNSESSPIWQIKKIWQDGTVWRFQFPTGDQSFSHVWANRASLTYA